MACARGYFDACGCETRIRLPDNPGSLGTRESCTGCRATTISRAAVDDDVAFSQLHPRRRDTCTLQPEDKPGCSTAPLQFQSSEVQPTTSTNVELDKGRPDPRDTRAPIGFSTSDVVRPRKLLVRNTYSTTISSAARAYALGAHVTEASWQSSSFIDRPILPPASCICCRLWLLSYIPHRPSFVIIVAPRRWLKGATPTYIFRHCISLALLQQVFQVELAQRKLDDHSSVADMQASTANNWLLE
jgi:hypothetical protein